MLYLLLLVNLEYLGMIDVTRHALIEKQQRNVS